MMLEIGNHLLTSFLASFPVAFKKPGGVPAGKFVTGSYPNAAILTVIWSSERPGCQFYTESST